jgi:hypothetical protein
MNKPFLLFLLFLSILNTFSQTEILSTPLYEIEFNKKQFDYYPNNKNHNFILFYKFNNKEDDYFDCIRLEIDNLNKFKKMDLDYYANLKEYELKNNSQIIEKTKTLNANNSICYKMIYTKFLGKNLIKIYQKVYFKNGYGYTLSLKTVEKKYDNLVLESKKIFDSFKLLN